AAAPRRDGVAGRAPSHMLDIRPALSTDLGDAYLDEPDVIMAKIGEKSARGGGTAALAVTTRPTAHSSSTKPAAVAVRVVAAAIRAGWGRQPGTARRAGP